MQQPKLVQSRKTTPEDRDWHEYIRKAEKETANRLEDAAKFLATIAGLSLTLFLATAGQTGLLQTRPQLPVKVAVALWLLSLLCAFFVLFPWRYRYAKDSARAIRQMHRKIVRIKDTLLVISMALYIGAVGLLAVIILGL